MSSITRSPLKPREWQRLILVEKLREIHVPVVTDILTVGYTGNVEILVLIVTNIIKKRKKSYEIRGNYR